MQDEKKFSQELEPVNTRVTELKKQLSEQEKLNVALAASLNNYQAKYLPMCISAHQEAEKQSKQYQALQKAYRKAKMGTLKNMPLPKLPDIPMAYHIILDDLDQHPTEHQIELLIDAILKSKTQTLSLARAIHGFNQTYLHRATEYSETLQGNYSILVQQYEKAKKAAHEQKTTSENKAMETKRRLGNGDDTDDTEYHRRGIYHD
jgi:hypothetical protein